MISIPLGIPLDVTFSVGRLPWIYIDIFVVDYTLRAKPRLKSPGHSVQAAIVSNYLDHAAST
ncbi:MAG: hypothetical protein JO232_05740 [Verrucomicrobia bacterium]|nr:hypothetical protein [Verrucomicrobiota bacterium]